MQNATKFLTLLAILACTTISQSSQAGEFGFVCDNCADSTYQTVAKTSVGVGQHTVLIFDTVRWKATQWLVRVEAEGPMTRRTAIQLTLDDEIEEGFAFYKSITEDFLLPWGLRPIEVPPSAFGSPYDIVGNPDAMNDLYDWFSSGARIPVVYGSPIPISEWGINWAFTAAADLTTKLTNLAPVVKFEFADGGTMTVSLNDWDPIEFSFIFEFRDAFDANGDVLPWVAEQYDPDEPVNGGVARYLGNQYIGYTVYDLSGHIVGGTDDGKMYEMDCEFNENNSLVCTLKEIE